MFSYFWPIALVVASNVIYQICAKSVAPDVNPFAALTVTYLVGAAFSIVMFFVTGSGGSLVKEMTKVNWASYLLGMSIIGLEVGFIYAYKAGWAVSTASIVQSAFLAVALIAVGFLLYKEALTWNKLLGIAICLIGLVFINLK